MNTTTKMETKWYHLGKASSKLCSVRVKQCEGVPLHMRAHSREVTSLLTPEKERGKGYATTLMHKVCRDADTTGTVLILSPRSFSDGGLSDSYLESWYASSFGFQVIQKEPETIMARMPGATPRVLQLKPLAQALQGAKR